MVGRLLSIGMFSQGSLVVAVLLAVAGRSHACWYQYDAEDCYIAYQGVRTDCQASYDFLSTFVKGVRVALALTSTKTSTLCDSGAEQTPRWDARLQLDGTFAPASSAANDPDSICLLYSPYSCTATYKSYLANGGNGVNATYPACPANLQTALRAWIDAGAFETSGVADTTSRTSGRLPSRMCLHDQRTKQQHHNVVVHGLH